MELIAKNSLKKGTPDMFFNRELSWIEFNKRVLEEAQDENNPLLERAKFLSIFSSNLDEFFMIRVSGVKRQILSDINELSSDGISPHELMDRIYQKLSPLVEEQYRLFNNDIYPKLAENNIKLFKYAELTDEEKKRIDKYFEDEIFPILTPLAIDNVHPFPNLINRSIALAILLDDPDTETIEEKLSVVQVPSNIVPRFYQIEGREENSFILLEDIILANIDKLFPGMATVGVTSFRITRNADLELEEEEAADLLTLIEEEVKKRRLGLLVRLEIDKNCPDKLKSFLTSALNVEKNEIYEIDGPLNLGDLMVLTKIENRKLKYEPFTPRISSFFREDDDVFKNISRQDIYLHHPFYSFSSVSEFIAQAAVDPKVYAIKLTLYRTSGDSAIINSLITAAENGKQVTAVVELKARFDEENNIIWARALENAGVHVVYGLIGLKTHCKIALVVRKEDEKMKRYVHLSTGNYNQTTSKLYTDFGLFTANEDFGKDATQLFNYLTGYSKKHSFKELVVAPINMRKTILGLIDNEIQKHKEHNNGYILAKMNSLVDEEVILKLYEASNAGVKIELMIRGICRLKPGVKGMSENISVYSLVGRFLEHSRAFYFNNNGESNLYLSSADWMPRNLDRRIEIMFPIEDERVKEDILEALKLYLTDNVKCRILKSDGTYEKLSSGNNKIDIQETFVRRVIKKHTTDSKKDIKKKIKKLAVKHLSIVK